MTISFHPIQQLRPSSCPLRILVVWTSIVMTFWAVINEQPQGLLVQGFCFDLRMPIQPQQLQPPRCCRTQVFLVGGKSVHPIVPSSYDSARRDWRRSSSSRSSSTITDQHYYSLTSIRPRHGTHGQSWLAMAARLNHMGTNGESDLQQHHQQQSGGGSQKKKKKKYVQVRRRRSTTTTTRASSGGNGSNGTRKPIKTQADPSSRTKPTITTTATTTTSRRTTTTRTMNGTPRVLESPSSTIANYMAHQLPPPHLPSPPTATTSSSSSSSSSFSSPVRIPPFQGGVGLETSDFTRISMLQHDILTMEQEQELGRALQRALALQERIQQLQVDQQQQKQQQDMESVQTRRPSIDSSLLSSSWGQTNHNNNIMNHFHSKKSLAARGRKKKDDTPFQLSWRFQRLVFPIDDDNNYSYNDNNDDDDIHSMGDDNDDTIATTIRRRRRDNNCGQKKNGDNYSSSYYQEESDVLDHMTILELEQLLQGGMENDYNMALDDMEQRNSMGRRHRRNYHYHDNDSRHLYHHDDPTTSVVASSTDNYNERRMAAEFGFTKWDVQHTLGLSNGFVELQSILLQGAIARDTLIRNNIRLVVSIAKKWCKQQAKIGGIRSSSSGSIDGSGSGVMNLRTIYQGSWDRPSLDEAIQEGILGLSEAVNRFQPERNLKFGTYATAWVTNYIRRCFNYAMTTGVRATDGYYQIRRNYNALIKSYHDSGQPVPCFDDFATELNVTPERLQTILTGTRPLISLQDPLFNSAPHTLAGKAGNHDVQDFVSIGDLLVDDDEAVSSPEQQVELSFLRQNLENAMASELFPFERDVLRLRLGLDDGCSRTVSQIVDEYGGALSQTEIRSAESRAYKKLRSPKSLSTYKLLAYLDFAGIDRADALLR